jgi:replicative DNA helicase
VTAQPRQQTAPLPPQNLDSEESVLGAMMLAKAAVVAVAETGLRAEHFYRESHGVIYDAMLALDERGEAVDAITVADELDRTGMLVKVPDGAERVHELAALVPAASNAAHYARIVREMATLRGLIRAGNDIARLGFDRPGDTAELVDQAERIVFDLAAGDEHGQTYNMREILEERYRALVDAHREGRKINGLPTGFAKLDDLLSGLQPGSLVIVAARPSMGKSAFVVNVATNVVQHDVPVLLFTLEMSRAEVAQRVIISEGLIDGQKARSSSLTADDWDKLKSACKALADKPLLIDETPAITVTEVRAKARRLKAKHPNLGLVVVDYLQIMGMPDGENRTQQVGRVTAALKALARELEVPVVALSQLSREVEKRHDKRPTLADLRDSGSIEQDADVVMFLYRDDHYHEDSDHAGTAEVIVAKQRNGPTDTVRLAFRSRFTRFDNL